MYIYKTEVPDGSWGLRARDLAAVREAFRECFGDFREKEARRAPLDLAVLETTDLGGGLVKEKVHYQTEPGEYVPAYLLRPAKPIGPLAAVIAFHGHGGKYHVGKEGVVGSDPEFRNIGMGFGLQFARAGYVVLCPDSVCFGERRNPYPDRWPDAFWERVVAMRETASGGCMARKNVWDSMRAVDVLQSLPYVDPDRIGGCGLSMGSGMTFYTMMWERRLKVGVAVCSMYTLKVLYGQPLMHCFMNWIPRMVERGLEMYDVFPLIAPRPLLLINPTDSSEDPLAETRELYEKSRWAWEEAGRPEALELEVFEGTHEFPPAMRQKALDWLRRWL
jgi:dienelactone hydrolase